MRTTSTGATGFWTFAGNFLSLSWLGIAGALLGSSAASGESPIDALFRLTGPFHVAALLVVLISSFSQNFLNVYGGAISVQTLRIPVSRRTAVILICAAAYLISLWADESFEAKFKTFLFLGAYLIAPFGAVLLLDYVLGHRHDRARIAELYDSRRILEWGFVAWLIGAAASMLFWNLSFFVGPLAKSHPGVGRPLLLRRVRRRMPRLHRHLPAAPVVAPQGPGLPRRTQPLCSIHLAGPSAAKQLEPGQLSHAVLTERWSSHCPTSPQTSPTSHGAYWRSSRRPSCGRLRRSMSAAESPSCMPQSRTILSGAGRDMRQSDAILDHVEVPVCTAKAPDKWPNTAS